MRQTESTVPFFCPLHFKYCVAMAMCLIVAGAGAGAEAGYTAGEAG